MIVMFFIILIQIVARIILGVPTAWSVELGIIVFTLIVFFGMPNIARERSHLRVDALYQLFPEKMKRVVDLLCGLVYVAFFVVLAWGAYRNIEYNWDVEIPTIEWAQLGWAYLVLFLAILLNIWSLLLNIVEDFVSLGKNKCSPS